jgi:hypothetical protein
MFARNPALRYVECDSTGGLNYKWLIERSTERSFTKILLYALIS